MSYLQSPLFLLYLLFLYAHITVGGGQRTMTGSQFFPSAMRVLGLELKP